MHHLSIPSETVHRQPDQCTHTVQNFSEDSPFTPAWLCAVLPPAQVQPSPVISPSQVKLCPKKTVLFVLFDGESDEYHREVREVDECNFVENVLATTMWANNGDYSHGKSDQPGE